MSREGALLVMVGVAVVVLALLAWAWVRRTRRDARFTAPVGELPEDAVETAAFPGLYVATTRHDEPLERLAIKGLGFRSRVDVTVTTAGVALDLPGQPRIALTPDRLVDAAQATVAIDRVVEAGGLTRISWRIDDATVVDTYLRPQDASAKALADAIRPLITTTGSDA
ncbi:hypothetical protein [Microbacterium enclense]|uniref:PH domain-containing protein n=1 Tax=Microbacterium enclense TaxID=993073 RepID=A0A1G6PSI3_9MICO|nr:hypothetical protein [Microbacterium enclense]KSU52491.1 hypothetical protein AS029_14145 [Microbacterium enclense]SDC83190.1 hypothetical protein SAMN05216418_3110 [Microbacterium enclense]